MASTPSTAILFVPGSFALPEFYDPVFEKVRAKGYNIQGLHMPTVGLSASEGRPTGPGGGPPTMYDDAAYIATEAERLADQGTRVVIIGHSYGGVPVSQSTKGLSVADRSARGLPGGVARLAYMTCLVPGVGETAVDVLSKGPQDQQVEMDVDDSGWMTHRNPEKTASLILQTIPLDEATALVKLFPKHSAPSFVNQLTYAGYKDIPVSYLLCEDDLCIPPDVQQRGIDIIEEQSGSKVDVTRIKADHCPNHSAMQSVVDWIVSVAEKAST
ncbi:hypothetical protein PV08_11925 [Exophiala spinifera]|uniref:AB hydrolase-1 domain-containing protein n=1 Tax=Exophiala spinifera TaxID=91928 RepID=A0A0D2BEK6_9EURO|nr:uncharacterized protein PV08_11925 [Exophiala spinifera]KIW09824.1 hypothetical protein PV08_11925 [Exophiala spinifera]